MAEFTGAEHCIYCGDYYQCRDHVIPVSYNQVYRDYKHGATVYCCNECNSLLSNKAYFTIQDRASYLLEAYRKKRWKEITFPEWRINEVKELGYNLRTMVERSLKLKSLYLSKLENIELVSQGFPIKPINPLYVRGRQISVVIGHLETLEESKLFQKSDKDEDIRKNLRGSVSQNLRRGIFYRVIKHKDGRTVNAFNLSEFMRIYKLKINFDGNSDWRITQIKETDFTRDAVVEIGLQMIKAGKALC